MLRRSAFFVMLILALQSGQSPAIAEDQAGSTRWIRRVIYERANVFPGDELSGTQKTANRLHILTQEAVIAREVLLNPGDPMSEELRAESERKLRNLDFLGDAEITTRPVGTDSLDVIVSTNDQWSLIPAVVLTSGGGLTRIGGSLEESNFLGRGKFLWGTGEYENDVGTTWYAGYDDPQLLGSQLKAGVSFASGPLEQSWAAYINRPFYSSDSIWSWGANGGTGEEIRRIFDYGEEVSRYGQNIDEAALHATRAIGERYRKWRFSLSYSYSNEENFPIDGQTTLPIPVNELIHATTLGVSRENRSFAVERRINKLGRKEDLALGNSSYLYIGRTAFPFDVGVRRWQFGAGHDHKIQLQKHHFLYLGFDFTTEFEKDTIFSFDTRWYNVVAWQTLALNIEGDFSNDLDIGRQFVLGGDSGLRGYPAREFTGAKRLLMNLESRVNPKLEVWTVALGGVVFVDVGNVWDRNQDVDFKDLNVGAGAGLRLEFTRTPGAPVSRIDIGWPVNRSGGPALTLGIEQHF